ncbi:hypothetical protein OAG68_02130 [bacterium]|nr:hypothetical protein [bacterium]
MAWEISISVDGWIAIREALEKWNVEQLVDAISDDEFERVFEIAGMRHAERAANAERDRINELPHDNLADRAFELIQQNNTSDNGGFAYWIDREGHHKVWLQ